jgi:hypothetical protein
MIHLERAKGRIAIIVAISCVAGANAVSIYLTSSLNVHPAWFVFAGITLAFFAAELTSWLTTLALDRSSFLRRLALGKSQIEGVWATKVYLGDGRDRYAVTIVSYKKGEWYFRGTDFDEAGNFRTTFGSEGTILRGDKLFFFYSDTGDAADNCVADRFGFGYHIYYTHAGDSSPDLRVGLFMNSMDRRLVRTRAYKVADRHLVKQILEARHNNDSPVRQFFGTQYAKPHCEVGV